MRRRPAGLLAALVAVLSVAGSCGVHDRLLVTPFLQHATAGGVVITWESIYDGTSEVLYGRKAPLRHTVRLPGRRRLHQVELRDLSGGDQWFYRVRTVAPDGRVCGSRVYSFTTDRGAQHPCAFAVVGDTQDQPAVWEKIAAGIWAERPQFLVHCGDLVGFGRQKREWVEEFFEPASTLLAHVPLYGVLGNHEEDAGHYYRYAAHPAPEHRYTFRYGCAQFFMLDSNRDLERGSAQHRWLDEALAASAARWKFVVLHHPPYTSDRDDYGDTERRCVACGDPRVRDAVVLFEKHDVDVVFYGHIHAYERTWPLRGGRVDHERGTVYVQTGGAGGRLEESAPRRSWFTAKLRRAHHYCYVMLRRDRFELQAFDITGRMFDRFVIEKGMRVARVSPRLPLRPGG